MLSASVYVGADVAKDFIVLCGAPLALPATITNDRAGHRALLARLRRSPTAVHVVCEATGPCHRDFVAALYTQRKIAITPKVSERNFHRVKSKR